MAQNLLVRGMNNMLLDAREDRLINEILTEGLFEPGDEFRVQQQGSPNMTVRVGSGSVGDRYVVEGPGGTYLVRNPDPWIGSGNGDLPIANGDPTFDRIDGIDLVVYDDSIDSSGMSKAEVVVTQGAPASSPSAPALPTGFAAVARLATVLVAAGESTAITSGSITDTRVASSVWTRPRGYVGHVNLSGSAGGSETALTGSVTHIASPGRRYKVTAQYGVFTSTDQGNVTFRLKRDGSTVATHSAHVGGSSVPDRAAGTIVWLEEGISGSTTWSATLQCISAVRSINTQIGPRQLIVEDIGGFLP